MGAVWAGDTKLTKIFEITRRIVYNFRALDPNTMRSTKNDSMAREPTKAREIADTNTPTGVVWQRSSISLRGSHNRHRLNAIFHSIPALRLIKEYLSEVITSLSSASPKNWWSWWLWYLPRSPSLKSWKTLRSKRQWKKTAQDGGFKLWQHPHDQNHRPHTFRD